MRASSSLFAALLLAAAFAAPAATETLFEEGFSNCATVWKNSAKMDFSLGAGWVDNGGWSGSGCYRGTSGIKMGTTSVGGTATTPLIAPSNSATSVSLALQAAAYAGKDGTLSIIASTATETVVFSTNVTLTAMTSDTMGAISDASYAIGPFAIDTTTPFFVSFQPASGDCRMAIDSIVIEQTCSVTGAGDAFARIDGDGGEFTHERFV